MGNKKITCRENSKYDFRNRSLQDKPHATWTVSKSRSNCQLLHFAINTENWAQTSQLHNPTQLLPQFHRRIFTLWVAVGVSTSPLHSVLTLQQLQHCNVLVGTRATTGQPGEVSFPNLFKIWASLHATALWRMKSHRTACQPGSGLAFTIKAATWQQR